MKYQEPTLLSTSKQTKEGVSSYNSMEDMMSSTLSHIHLRSMQQCKLRPYSHIQANYGHASKKNLIMEATRRLPWYACTHSLGHQLQDPMTDDSSARRDASSDNTCLPMSLRSRPTMSLRHANYSTRSSIKLNAATIMISPYLICCR